MGRSTLANDVSTGSFTPVAVETQADCIPISPGYYGKCLELAKVELKELTLPCSKYWNLDEQS